MGYDVHIHRREHWADEHPELSQAEWFAWAAEQEDFELEAAVHARLPEGNVLTYAPDGGIVVWSHPSGHEVPFDWRRGRVVVKAPDSFTLFRMIDIAEALGAVVHGDDGERYRRDEAGRVLVEAENGRVHVIGEDGRWVLERPAPDDVPLWLRLWRAIFSGPSDNASS